VTDIEVHPVADLFPMLAADELAELAADIKARGLRHPIVLDSEGRVLDGRNRLAACELARVKPTFETYDGEDPEELAWGDNVRRRNLTKAQMAVLAADRFADNKLSTRAQAKKAGVSYTMIQWAHAVRRYQDLHDDVLLRGKSLNETYTVAQERDAVEARRQAQIDRLRAAAPDLLSLVDDDQLSVADAVAVLDAREEKARLEAGDQATIEKIDQIRDRDGAPPPSFAQRAESGALTWKQAADEAERWLKDRADALERDRQRLHSIVASWGTIRTILADPNGTYVIDILAGLGEFDLKTVTSILNDLKESSDG
jgi:hypothetical protein